MHARRILALLALHRQPILLQVGERAVRTHLDNAIPVLAERNAVLVLAGHLARMAADATVQINN